MLSKLWATTQQIGCENMSKYIDKKHNELRDDVVIRDMKKAIEMYEDGEIIESTSLLIEIYNEVTDWEPNQ